MLLRNIKHVPDYTVSTHNHVILISCAMSTSNFINASRTSDSVTVGLCVCLALSSIRINVTSLRVSSFFFHLLVIVVRVLLKWRWERGTSGIILTGEPRSMEYSNESALRCAWETNRLWLYEEVMDVCCNNHTENTSEYTVWIVVRKFGHWAKLIKTP